MRWRNVKAREEIAMRSGFAVSVLSSSFIISFAVIQEFSVFLSANSDAWVYFTKWAWLADTDPSFLPVLWASAVCVNWCKWPVSSVLRCSRACCRQLISLWIWLQQSFSDHLFHLLWCPVSGLLCQQWLAIISLAADLKLSPPCILGRCQWPDHSCVPGGGVWCSHCICVLHRSHSRSWGCLLDAFDSM